MDDFIVYNHDWNNGNWLWHNCEQNTRWQRLGIQPNFEWINLDFEQDLQHLKCANKKLPFAHWQNIRRWIIKGFEPKKKKNFC